MWVTNYEWKIRYDLAIDNQFCSFFSVPFSSKANFQVYVLWELCIILFCYPELRNIEKTKQNKKDTDKEFCQDSWLESEFKDFIWYIFAILFFFKFKRIAFLKLGIMFSLSLQKLFYWDIQVTEFQDFNFYDIIECICK